MNSLAEDARDREVLGPGVDIVIETYDETNRRVVPARIIRDLQAPGRASAGRHRRRAVEPVSARDRHRAPVPRRGRAGLHRRVPRLGLHRHAAGNARRTARGAGARHCPVRRRSGGAPARRSAARRMARRDEAALQLHGPSPLARGRSPRRSCRASTSSALPAPIPASISAAAAPISARSAPSSTCRAARAAFAPPTISNRSSARTRRRASTGSSSPTTISPATATGRSCSTGSSSSRSARASTSASPSRSTRSATRSRISSRRRPRPGCKRVFIGLENINPDNLIAAKKRQNKITEYRVMLQKWRAHGAHHLRRLHPRLPGRHEGIDPARHRDHQARTAARHSRVLLPDPAAGLGGPQDPVEEGGLDGPRHQQIRPQPSRFASRENVGRRVGGGLPGGLGRHSTRPSTCERSSGAPPRSRTAGRSRSRARSCGSS